MNGAARITRVGDRLPGLWSDRFQVASLRHRKNLSSKTEVLGWNPVERPQTLAQQRRREVMPVSHLLRFARSPVAVCEYGGYMRNYARKSSRVSERIGMNSTFAYCRATLSLYMTITICTIQIARDQWPFHAAGRSVQYPEGARHLVYPHSRPGHRRGSVVREMDAEDAFHSATSAPWSICARRSGLTRLTALPILSAADLRGRVRRFTPIPDRR